MKPGDRAMSLVSLYRQGHIQRSDVEVAIGMAKLSSRTKAVRLASEYFLVGRSVQTVAFGDQYSKLVGWLWRVRNDGGWASFTGLIDHIRADVDRCEQEERRKVARERGQYPHKFKGLFKDLEGEWTRIGDIAEALNIQPLKVWQRFFDGEGKRATKLIAYMTGNGSYTTDNVTEVGARLYGAKPLGEPVEFFDRLADIYIGFESAQYLLNS